MRKWLPIGLITVCVFSIYWHTLHYPFLFDDIHDIVNNLAIRSLASKAILTSSRPLAYLSFAVNYRLHGLTVEGYRLINILIHLTTALLVRWLILLIFQTPAMRQNRFAVAKNEISLVAALLFAVHPVQTQAVTYIVQRMASLAACFYVLSVCCYLKARLSTNRRWILFIASAIAGVAGVLTKQNAVTLPLMILLLEFAFFHQGSPGDFFRQKRVIVITATGLATFVVFLVRYSGSLFRTIPPQQGNAFSITPLAYLLTQCRVVWTYLRLLILPTGQNLDYDYPISPSLTHIPTLFAAIGIIALLGISVFLWNRQRLASVGILWYFISLLVESSVIPLPNVIFEHRIYLPSVGIVIAVLPLFGLLLQSHRRHFAISVLMVWIVLLMGTTFKRNQVWQSKLTLWNDVVRKSPGKARPWNNRGEAYRELGKYDLALHDYNRALAIYPAYAAARNNRAGLYMLKQQYNKAIADLTSAITAHSGDAAELYYNRGTCYLMQRRFRNAATNLKQAVSFQSNYPKAWLNLGSALLQMGQFDESRAAFRHALNSPVTAGMASLYIGISYFEQQQNLPAVKWIRQALQRDSTMVNAWVLLGRSQLRLNKPHKAVKALKHALQLKTSDSEAAYYCSQAYYHLGQFDLAWRYLQQAQQAGRSIDPQLMDSLRTLALNYNE